MDSSDWLRADFNASEQDNLTYLWLELIFFVTDGDLISSVPKHLSSKKKIKLGKGSDLFMSNVH